MCHLHSFEFVLNYSICNWLAITENRGNGNEDEDVDGDGGFRNRVDGNWPTDL